MATEPVIPLSQMPNPTGRLYSHHDEEGNVSYSTEPPHGQKHHDEITPEENKPTRSKKYRSWSKVLNMFLFVLIVSALGLSYYMFQQMSHIGEHVGQQVAIVSTSQHSSAQNIFPAEKQETPSVDVQKTLQSLTVKQQQLEQQLSDSSTAQAELQTLTTKQQQLEQQLLDANDIQKELQTLATKQQQLEQQLSDLNAMQAKVEDSAKQQLETHKTALNIAVSSLEQDVSGLKQTLQQVQNDNNVNAQDWILSEVGYLLNLAQHRLQLIQDAQTALIILKAAKDKLQQWEKPQLTQTLIAQIEQDIKQLNLSKINSSTQIIQQLSQYIQQVPQLSLVKVATPPSISTPTESKTVFMLESWGDVTSIIWREMKQLVTISYNENIDHGLLTSEQRFIVQQNLSLKLEAARLAFLKSDFTSFKNILHEANGWLNQYYDQNATNVLAMQTGLQQLNNTDFIVNYPDMSTSLTILNRIQLQ